MVSDASDFARRRGDRTRRKPSKWVRADVLAGAQADQFLQAYYHNQVLDGGRSPYEEKNVTNRANPERALADAVRWWVNSQRRPQTKIACCLTGRLCFVRSFRRIEFSV